MRSTTPTTPHPVDDPGRVRMVEALDAAAQLSGPCLDAIAELARVRTAAVEGFVNLVSDERQLLRGRAPLAGPREGRVADGFCPFSVATARVLAIGDTRQDVRTRENPAVAAGLRAYLGVPLVVGGYAVGTVCVVDRAPRAWTPREIEALVELSGRAVRELEQAGVLTATG